LALHKGLEIVQNLMSRQAVDYILITKTFYLVTVWCNASEGCTNLKLLWFSQKETHTLVSLAMHDREMGWKSRRLRLDAVTQ
jgi:hypothetical protein